MWMLFGSLSTFFDFYGLDLHTGTCVGVSELKNQASRNLVMVIASLLILKLNTYIKPPNCLHY